LGGGQCVGRFVIDDHLGNPVGQVGIGEDTTEVVVTTAELQHRVHDLSPDLEHDPDRGQKLALFSGHDSPPLVYGIPSVYATCADIRFANLAGFPAFFLYNLA